MSDGQGSSPTTKRRWTFSSTHPDSLNLVLDFGEFADGAGDVHPGGSGASKWQGGFSGRPGLMHDLMPTVVAIYGGRAIQQQTHLKTSIRAFWRFLDAYEAWLADSGNAFPRIDRLHQITGAILQAYSEPGPEARWVARVDGNARTVRTLIHDAVHASELQPISVAALKSPRRIPKEVVCDEEGIALIRHLRGSVTQIFRRWRRADVLAAQGRDLIMVGRVRRDCRPTEADAHATYRALIQRTSHPLPSVPALMTELGYMSKALPVWWPRYEDDQLPAGRSTNAVVSWEDCVAGLYPTSGDLASCALLCLGRSAWNPAVLCNLDIHGWTASYDDDHAWIHAFKSRGGGTIQHSISAISHPTGFYQVVTRLIARNASIRAWIASHRDAIANAEYALRTPWLGSSCKPGVLFFTADPRDTSNLNNRLRSHINEHNTQPSAKLQISKMTSSDFRDVAAATMYRESRYSMWTVMLLLGHKNLSTTRRYVYTRAGRQESHRLVAQVVGDAMDQIERTKAWDPVMTRASVEGIQVDSAARERLDVHRKNRTYAGAVCNDPCNPPVDIDPTHPNDGRSHCIQGHLCIARACPKATAFNDSLGDICKCVADLEWRQLHSGAVRFSTGSEEQDLENLRESLTQWPLEAVEVQLALWRELIERGEHRPIWFAGQR